MNETREPGPEADDALLEAILRRAEPRPRPSEAARERAFEALHATWSRRVAHRRRRRAVTGVAAAALVASAAALLWIEPPPPTAAPVVVTLVRSSGGALEVNGVSVPASAAPEAAGTLVAGDRLATAPGTRAALAWGNGSLRLDEATRIELGGGNTLQLSAGALYFDSTPWGHAGAEASRIVVETHFGRIVHAGTQFQAALRGDQLRVSVREGEVRIEGDRLDVGIAAGEAIWYAADGRFERRMVAAYDAGWAWTAEIAPLEDFTGRTTADVLDWVARETGFAVRYGSDRARQLADSEARGIEALEPLPALRTLPVMTSLTLTVDDGIIRVDSTSPGVEP